MKVERLRMSIEQITEQEYTAYIAARSKAIEDYNIMMNNLADPLEMEEDEENE